ncbi:MAG: amidohydrolase family protein [Verrucomicrobia bacterium]|nr:amidohydrolase family protein [Verrucomicrobiota bacterium]
MSATPCPAIDAHAHYGTYTRDDGDALVDEFMSASAGAVVARARACGVAWTIASPLAGLLPRLRADAAAGNEAAFREVPKVPGLLQYVIVNPLQPATYDQARTMLRAPHCVGIKIHPEEHGYRIADHGERLFAFFDEVQAPVMTHSGCPNSLPADFVPFANRHPGVRLLLAHLGNGAGDRGRADLQVRAIQACRHGNVWVDTSSARSLVPGLVEWACRELGPERLLFGSDTPLYHVAMQRARIEAAEIPATAQRLILRENALRFFRLDRRPEVAAA